MRPVSVLGLAAAMAFLSAGAVASANSRNLAPDFESLPPHARYALFIWVRDGYSTAGRKAAIFIAAALGVALPHGQQSAYASLVDLESGRVLWFNRVLRGFGDLREAESASGTVDALLTAFPAAK